MIAHRPAKEALMKTSRLLLFTLVLAISLASTRSGAQSQTTTAATPVFEYEVASIKPSKPSNNGVSSGFNYSGNGFTATGLTLQSLIQQVFEIQNDQLAGAPVWLNTERYNIDAKMDSSVADALQKLSPDDCASARLQMLKALLVDRLKLTFHRDTKELPIYSLLIAKNGPKLKEAKPGDTYPNGIAGMLGPGMSTSSRLGSVSLSAQGVPLSGFVRQLAQFLHRTVADKTGLTGTYDFTLRWSTDESGMQSTPEGGGTPSGASSLPQTDHSAPTLFAAIQEQLGLKLERGKGPVELIVIDHVERPAGN
jgi:uncharacterized protein (TIGR03435 family)